MNEKKTSYNLLIGVFALIAVVLAVGIAGYLVAKPRPVTIQGEAEATEYRVSGKVPGRVEQFFAKAGDMVCKGDTLVLIDSPEVRAKLAQARAARDAAVALSTKAANGATSEQIQGAYEMWQKALVGEEIAEKSFARVQRLFEQKVISAQKRDEAEAQYKAAKAPSAAANSQYDAAVKGARAEDKAAAAAQVSRADGAIMEVEGYLDELYLTAPASGVISATYPKQGELVGTGSPVMTVTDLDDMWFTFSIREDMLNGLKTGDMLKVRIPALGNDTEYETKVSYISVLASYATWRATQDTGDYDARTFAVKSVPVGRIEGLRPGMTALVTNR